MPEDTHSHDHQDSNMRALAIALTINSIFFVVEFAGAIYSNSLALLADSMHMITDSGSIALALLAAWIATIPPDEKRTYGYQRAEILGALANAVFLIAIVIFITYDAFNRFLNPQPIKPLIVIGVGSLGLLANLAAAYPLYGKRDNLNIEGAYIHLLADAAGSVAAIMVGITLYFTDLYILDPFFGVVIAGLILYSAKDLLRDSLHQLLQGTPPGINIDELRLYLLEIEGVQDAHDIHAWSLSSNEHALSAHIVVNEETDTDEIISLCQRELHSEFGIDHATIQVESPRYTHTLDFDCYNP